MKWWNPWSRDRRSNKRNPYEDRSYQALRVIQTGASISPWDKQDEYTVETAKRLLREGE